MPFQLDPNSADQGHYFAVVARLKPGVSLEQAQARLQASAAEYRAKFPAGWDRRRDFRWCGFARQLIGGTRPAAVGAAGRGGLWCC